MEQATMKAETKQYFSWQQFRPIELASLGVVVLLCALFTIWIQVHFARTSITLFIAIVSMFVVAYAVFAFWTYFHVVWAAAEYRSALRILLLDIAVSLLGAAVFEFLTIVGIRTDTPLLLSDWSQRRLVIFAGLCAVAVTFRRYFYTRCCRGNSTAFKRFLLNPQVLIPVGLCGLLWLLAGATGVLSWEKPSSGERLAYFFCAIAAGGIALALLKHYGKLYVHRVFVVIALTFGTVFALATPHSVGVSWDDETHYSRSAGLSYLGAGEYTNAEAEYAFHLWINQDGEYFDVDDEERLNEEYQKAPETGRYADMPSFVTVGFQQHMASITTIGAAPSGIGLWLGRLIQLPLDLQIMLGRWANLIFYVAMMALAIKTIPVKKVALLGIGLIPTSLFLAANYSYDTWTTSLLALGLAMIVREFYEKNKPLTLGRFTAILIVLLLGLCAKAIYFPLAFLLFLMPKIKFTANLRWVTFHAATAGFIAVCAATVLLPLLFPAPGSDGDMRGGSDVSSSGQIAFITGNPGAFAGILGKFMLGYVSPVTANDYSVYFAYLGRLTESMPFLSAIPFVVLTATFLLDRRNDEPYPIPPFGRFLFGIDIVGIVAMIATALYISFTPVAYDTVLGAQPRYLIPLLLPVALLVSSKNVAAAGGQRILTRTVAGIWVAFNVFCSLALVVFI